MPGKLKEILEGHNKKFNPSGVPFKGDKKRSATDTEELESEASAEALGPLEESDPDTKAALKPQAFFPGAAANFEVLVKDGMLFVHGLQDGVVRSGQPLCGMWGRFLCGDGDKEVIAKNRSNLHQWAMNSVQFEAIFSISASQSQKLEAFKSTPSTLQSFLTHLEANNVAGFTVEVHELTHTTDPANPGAPMSYSIKPLEECFFYPQALPNKATISAENAGSALDLKQFDWENGTAKSGRVKMFLGLAYSTEKNTIMPVRPRLFPAKTFKLKKDEIVRLV